MCHVPCCHLVTATEPSRFEGFTFPLQAASTFQPRWDLVEADDWAKRQHLLQRFVQAGRRVICRLRASRRLARIMALAQGEMPDPTQVREAPSIQGHSSWAQMIACKACGFSNDGFGTKRDVSEPMHLGGRQQQHSFGQGVQQLHRWEPAYDARLVASSRPRHREDRRGPVVV